MDDLNLNMSALEDKNIFTGEDEVFAWQRLVSRLGEMQSMEYWEMCHKYWKPQE
jgi:protein AFG1